MQVTRQGKAQRHKGRALKEGGRLALILWRIQRGFRDLATCAEGFRAVPGFPADPPFVEGTEICHEVSKFCSKFGHEVSHEVLTNFFTCFCWTKISHRKIHIRNFKISHRNFPTKNRTKNGHTRGFFGGGSQNQAKLGATLL